MQTSESIKPEAVVQASNGLPVLRPFDGCQAAGKHILLESTRASLAIGLINDHTLRIAYSKADGSFPSSTVAIQPQEETPVSENGITVNSDETTIHCTLGEVKLTVDRVTGSMNIHHNRHGKIAEDVRFHIDSTGKSGVTVGARASTHFYGLGEQPGDLDKRHDAYTMWNSDVYAPHVPEMESLYVSIPFVITFDEGRATGFFLDNPGRSRFDFRTRFPDFEIHADTGGFDLYIFTATLKDVTVQYTNLTGRMQIPPRWAIGYHQSRYSYESQEEVLTLARSFKEKEIPISAIHLDIHYMNGYRVFTFDESRFPDPQAMIQQLKDLGIRIVPIVDPGVKRDPEYAVYRDGVEKDVFCKSIEGEIFFGEVWPGESAFPDFTDNRVSDWWGSQHDFYVERGISGIWNDMNEPAVFNEIKTMEPHIMHRNNGDPKTHREVHNLYGLLMSKATFEGLRQRLGGERPFVLTRAGYAGVQRYAAVWTGDNRSFWSHMEMAMPMVLNMGLSGIAFAGPMSAALLTIRPENYWHAGRKWGRSFLSFEITVHSVRPGQEPWSFRPGD